MTFRKLHRILSYFFTPFLAVVAVTGLLWAYSPYLYMKPDPAMKKMHVSIEDNGQYLAIPDVIRSARTLAKDGRVKGISLKSESGKLLYIVQVGSKTGPSEVWVDAGTGQASLPVRTAGWQIHQWVMKLHKLSFFGTKRELTAFPGGGLLLLLITGIFLWRKRNV